MENKNGFVTATDNARLGVLCIICRESVELTENEELAVLWGYSPIKVCNECRKAILHLRGLTTEGEYDE